jgi:hypothetical protein
MSRKVQYVKHNEYFPHNNKRDYYLNILKNIGIVSGILVLYFLVFMILGYIFYIIGTNNFTLESTQDIKEYFQIVGSICFLFMLLMCLFSCCAK